MKRCIISLSVFLFIITFVLVSEAIYTKNLAQEIDMQLNSYQGEESVEKIKEIFNRRRILSRIFLRENITEKMEIYITELEIYNKNKNEQQTELVMEKIRIFTKDLQKGRTF